jgi:hypothetical protein
MKIEKINKIYDKDYFQKFFIKKYNLSNLINDYFNYIDYENIFSFEDYEYIKAENFLIKLDKIFIKAYEFYFENFENNTELFKDFKNFFKKKLPTYFL